MAKKCILAGFVFLTASFFFPSHAAAGDAENIASFAGGFSRILSSTIQLPLKLVNNTMSQPFPFGIITGAVEGTVSTVTTLVSGVAQMGTAAAPYAKYAWIAAL